MFKMVGIAYGVDQPQYIPIKTSWGGTDPITVTLTTTLIAKNNVRLVQHGI
jgi:hypothetical protein